MLLSGAYVGQNTFCLKIVKEKQLIYGGERGIRTLDSVATIHAFQARAFNHSATSPTYFFYDLSQEIIC